MANALPNLQMSSPNRQIETSCSVLDADYLQSREKMEKATSHLRPSSEAENILRLLYRTIQEIFAQSSLSDKQLLQTNLQQQENLAVLLFKHCNIANAQVERLQSLITENSKQEVKLEDATYKQKIESLEMEIANYSDQNQELACKYNAIKAHNTLLQKSCQRFQDELRTNEDLLCDAKAAVIDLIYKLSKAQKVDAEAISKVKGKSLPQKIRLVERIIQTLINDSENNSVDASQYNDLQTQVDNDKAQIDKINRQLDVEKQKNIDLLEKIKHFKNECNNIVETYKSSV